MISTLILVVAGHARSRIAKAVSSDGTFKPQSLQPARVIDNAAPGAIEAGIASLLEGADVPSTNLVLAPVGSAATLRAAPAMTKPGMPRLLKLGVADGPGVEKVPQAVEVKDVSLDRLLVALAASRYAKQACMVVDAGSTVSVDYINSYGVLEGGIVAPGVGSMIRAWHDLTGAPTAKMPAVGRRATRSPMGTDSADALLAGCEAAVRGLVRYQLERIAEHAGAYPRVVATGDDAALLFEGDDLVENIVPDLAMLGALEAWRILAGVATPTAADQLEDDTDDAPSPDDEDDDL